MPDDRASENGLDLRDSAMPCVDGKSTNQDARAESKNHLSGTC